jgi:hypothetical protein
MSIVVREYHNYRELGDPPENRWRYPTYLAIGPKGQLSIRHMTPGRGQEVGDVPIRAIEGHPVLHPGYAKAGWVMYEDLCHGRVAGVAPDLQAWERWATLCGLLARGVTIPAGKLGDDFFHAEVHRRSEDGAVPRLTVQQLRELFPGATIADDALPGEAEKKN